MSAAYSADGPKLEPEPVCEVKFTGQPEVTIAARAEVVSDPVRLVVKVGRPLAVSMYLSGDVIIRNSLAVDVIAAYPVGAVQACWLSRPGNHADATDGVAFDTPIHSWWLTGVDVLTEDLPEMKQYRVELLAALIEVGVNRCDDIGSNTAQLVADAMQRRCVLAPSLTPVETWLTKLR